jgi:hypothetical protein
VITTDILDGINAEALSFQQAKARYDKAFRIFKMTTPDLAPEHFWPMVDSFRLFVLSTHSQERVAEAAADEFFRQAVIEQSAYSLSATVHFALSYREYSRKAYAGGDKCQFSFNRGDDGYGDLMDAVVLLGRTFNEALHAGAFRDLADFNRAVSDYCQDSVTAHDFPYQYADDPAGSRMALGSTLRKMILQGESYFAMSLEDTAQKWVASQSIKNERKGV